MRFKEFFADLRRGNGDAWWVVVFVALAVVTMIPPIFYFIGACAR